MYSFAKGGGDHRTVLISTSWLGYDDSLPVLYLTESVLLLEESWGVCICQSVSEIPEQAIARGSLYPTGPERRPRE